MPNERYKNNTMLDIKNEIAYRRKIANSKTAPKADVEYAKKRIKEMMEIKKKMEGKASK